MCFHCHGEHIGSSRVCLEYIRQQNINNIIDEQRVDYYVASNFFRLITKTININLIGYTTNNTLKQFGIKYIYKILRNSLNSGKNNVPPKRPARKSQCAQAIDLLHYNPKKSLKLKHLFKIT